jgi:hypothetical protein
MRPEISTMMKFIYPELKDHQSVTTFPNIKGMGKNLFFLDHNFNEDTNEMMQSKFNI